MAIENVDFELMMRILQGLQSDVADIKHSQLRMAADLTDLKTRVTALEQHFGGIYATMVLPHNRLDRLEERLAKVDELDKRLARIEDKLAHSE